jgi:hypothetical protein
MDQQALGRDRSFPTNRAVFGTVLDRPLTAPLDDDQQSDPFVVA